MQRLVGLTGVVIAAVVILLTVIRSPEDEESRTDPPSESTSLSVKVTSNPPSVAQGVSVGPAISPLDGPRQGRRAHPAPSDVLERFSLTSPDDAAQVAASLSDSDGQAVCSASFQLRSEREAAARASEKKDDGWAYPMEQKIREYVASRRDLGVFDILAIECRTSYCDLKVRGGGLESTAGFNTVIRAIGEQSWNDFTGYSTGENDQYRTLHARLTRMKSSRSPLERAPEKSDSKARLPSKAEEDGNAICVAWLNARERRKIAARNAEPRDAGWADPMEQLLHQYLTTQLRQHELARFQIDCRTTYCAIKGDGQGEDSFLAFQKASQAAPLEPWSDFFLGEASAIGESGSWTQEIILQRRDPGADGMFR